MSLSEKLIEHIRDNGPLTVAEYMGACLYDPDDGYYATRPGIGGANADFLTAPEASQMFGELIGLWCAHEWDALGKPAFNWIELGPGRGVLMEDAIRATIKKIMGEYWRNFSFIIERTVHDDEYVIVMGKFSATGAKTGIDVSFKLAEMWQVQNGRVVTMRVRVLEQLVRVVGDERHAVAGLEPGSHEGGGVSGVGIRTLPFWAAAGCAAGRARTGKAGCECR